LTWVGLADLLVPSLTVPGTMVSWAGAEPKVTGRPSDSTLPPAAAATSVN
jgi:hypothetical protein